LKLARILLLAAVPAAAQLGGHEPVAPSRTEAPAGDKQAILQELWQRRILPPDQSDWTPEDWSLLKRIRAEQADALELLAARFGGAGPWVSGRKGGTTLLTKPGFDKYVATLTQDALRYFQEKGVRYKWALKLRDMEDRPLFDKGGRITEAGAKVYRRASLNLEVFWKEQNGAVRGTRRPPADR
jgi:hypothetical protein